jgi:hypothetical protein
MATANRRTAGPIHGKGSHALSAFRFDQEPIATVVAVRIEEIPHKGLQPLAGAFAPALPDAGNEPGGDGGRRWQEGGWSRG